LIVEIKARKRGGNCNTFEMVSQGDINFRLWRVGPGADSPESEVMVSFIIVTNLPT